MTQFKTILMTAALLAVPSVALAQISTGDVTDQLKDKAVEGVLDNLTTDDAVTAGKTLLKGGSKEDAAVAVVKGRAEDQVENFTGTKVDLDDLSKEGMIDAGKDIAIDKAKSSATNYSDKAAGSATSYGDKAAGSATSYGDKAAGSHTTNTAPVIPKSGTTITEPAAVATPSVAPVSCPAGTKDAGDGTCMVTGDWKF